ncbi:MAG: FAD-dependent oxidoreductase [Opitutales bacterium]|nr:FAD-dependent oxidoreductase [Opitutales bacterium]
MNNAKPVLIVGAGMAGLCCALQLHKAGLQVRLFEASDAVGGRVRTDVVEGFLLDRGFQVYLDTYPETGQLLDLDSLNLKAFEPGALIYHNGRMHRLMDVFRRPGSAWSSATAPIGSLLDKLRVGLLRMKILASSFEAIASREDRSTEVYLREFGFSEPMIDCFFRSFYGGIFLERKLQTSSRMFEFTFKLFGRGSATLPAKGMGEIPRQLAKGLPRDAVQLNQPVRQVSPGTVTLENGEIIEGRATVVATDASTAQKLLPSLKRPIPEWRAVTNLYFAADQSPLQEAIICLNGSGVGRVNNVCAISDAAPSYAPEGQALLSVSVLGLAEEENLSSKVLEELSNWFGPQTLNWRHLRTDRIRRGLPEQLPGGDAPGFIQEGGIWLCGDHLSSASIEGAVVSGKKAAAAILASYR